MASAFFSAYELDFSEISLLEAHENGEEAKEKDALAFSVSVDENGETSSFQLKNKDLEGDIYQTARQIKKRVYKLFSGFSGKQLPWGTMTGIRPVKLYRKLYEKNQETVKSILAKEYFVTEEKINILERIFTVENRYLMRNVEEEISVYIGIPFCPSRCSYCSFSSIKAKEDRSDIKEYLEKLLKEIEGTVKGKKMKRVQSIYIGGGTPGILEPEEIKRLFHVIKESFPMAEEITFEGGRPDVLTKEKLVAVFEAGASRISINPQTMNNLVLASLNRSHGAEDVERVFKLARTIGFSNINMDLILGLPGETWKSFLSSLEAIIKLNPESITIHALALKKASEFMLSGLKHLEVEKPDITELIQNELRVAGYNPYYLYRQKNTFMNLENVGYAKDGYECVFNIQSMADKQSCLAFGADAVSKFVTDTGLIRLHNPKFPTEYNEKIEDLVEKKRTII